VRVNVSGALAAASVAVFVGCVIGVWATPDFWETIPALPCIVGAALLAASAFYAHRKSLVGALAIGVAVTIITFVATLAVGSSRWGS
jgi:uncharacterized protein YqgC (DUF456 family)